MKDPLKIEEESEKNTAEINFTEVESPSANPDSSSSEPDDYFPVARKKRRREDNKNETVHTLLQSLSTNVQKLVNKSEDMDGLFIQLLESRLRHMDESTKIEFKHKVELLLYETIKK